MKTLIRPLWKVTYELSMDNWWPVLQRVNTFSFVIPKQPYSTTETFVKCLLCAKPCKCVLKK